MDASRNEVGSSPRFLTTKTKPPKVSMMNFWLKFVNLSNKDFLFTTGSSIKITSPGGVDFTASPARWMLICWRLKQQKSPQHVYPSKRSPTQLLKGLPVQQYVPWNFNVYPRLCVEPVHLALFGTFWKCSLVATRNGLWKYRIYQSLCVFSNPKGGQLQGCIQAFPPKNAPPIFFRFFHPLQCFTQLAHKRHSRGDRQVFVKNHAARGGRSWSECPKSAQSIEGNW